MKLVDSQELRETLMHRILRRPHVLHAGFDEGVKSASHVVVLIHGLGRTSTMWQSIADTLSRESDDVRVIAVDLLGFGGSPKPSWQTYNAANQARSLHQTLRKLGIRQPVIIVGHSLGSLVAAEYTALFEGEVSHAILVSVPIYKQVPEKLFEKLPRRLFGESFYKGVLRNLRERQEIAKKLNYYGRRLKLFAPDFIVDDANVVGTMRSVEMAIENQQAYEHIMKLSIPVLLLYGRLDPFLIKKYYRALSRANANVSVASVVAGHEIVTNRRFSAAILRYIKRALSEQ